MKHFDKRTADAIVVFSTVDPGVNDDLAHGHDVKKFWVNTSTDSLFICTSPINGAATWSLVGGGGGGGGLSPIPASRILGNATAGLAIPTALTAAQVKTLLAIAAGDVSGLGSAALLAADTDITLGANSDARLATQKAVKAYVDGLVTGTLQFQGNTDCSGNPNYPSAAQGDMYVVSVAGKIGGASGKVVDVGDAYVANQDNAGGNEAGVGADWFVLEHNLVGAVLTVNGHTGPTVTVTAADVDAKLGAFVALTWAADKIPYFTGAGSAAVADFTSFGRTLVALADRDALVATVVPAKKKIVVLTDGATINVDASAGEYMTVTMAATGHNFAAVSNPPASGYVKYITIAIKQGGSGSNIPTFDASYKFSATNPLPTFSTGVNAVDRLVFICDSSGNMNCVGTDLGGV